MISRRRNTELAGCSITQVLAVESCSFVIVLILSFHMADVRRLITKLLIYVITIR